jgi:hypothetical protein
VATRTTAIVFSKEELEEEAVVIVFVNGYRSPPARVRKIEPIAGWNQTYSSSTNASASISTSISGEINALTCTMAVAGRML